MSLIRQSVLSLVGRRLKSSFFTNNVMLTLKSRTFSSNLSRNLPTSHARSLFLNPFPYSIRKFSSDANVPLTNDQVKRKVEEISENFSEAMTLLEDARDSLGTTYFSSDMKDAEEAVESILEGYNTLLKTISEPQKENVVRTIGLKINELKAQLSMIKDMIKD